MNSWTSSLSIIALIVGGIVIVGWLFPRRFVRAPFRVLLTLLYKKRVQGLENLPAQGGYVVVSNHVSWIDGILILWMLPRNVRFVVDGGNFNGPIFRYLANAFDTILMMPNPKSIGRSLKEAREGLTNGDVIGIFPEGTLSRTGQLQAFKPGLTKILKKTDAPVVPTYLEGMWGSIFSFSGGKFFFKWPQTFRRTLTLHIGPPVPGDAPLDEMRSAVAKLGADANIHARKTLGVPARRTIRAWKRRGAGLQVADSLGNEASGREMLIRVLALRRVLRRELLADDETHVGILLPPSLASVAANLAMAIDRRATVNLNYTVTSDVINHCTRSVGVRHILTSEKFLSKMDFELEAKTVPLETLKEKVTGVDKAVAFVMATFLPSSWLIRATGTHKIQSDDLLTVIFTSGSTGMPKGVELTNANVAHNIEAIGRAVRLTPQDVVLGVLPFFHSFGYSVTLWGANCLCSGVYHFNPLDSRQIGKLAQKYGATVLLGTPTFLRGYVRRVEPEQFSTLDVVVVGAEKMPPDLFDAFENQFGVRPVEGYGTTELSPLVSVNIPPSRSRAKYQADRTEGSVGRPVPGVSARIVSPDTGEELLSGHDGMLMVRGPNVMRGYAGEDEKTREVIRDGWYVTGDIAHLDAGGFIHITGRLSRFSKIGGEMVPHVRIEEEISRIAVKEESDSIRLAVTAAPCPKKGERLIVLHTGLDESPETIRRQLVEAGLPNLFIPSEDAFVEIDQIPLLGTGKLDLRAIKEKAVGLCS